MYQPVDGHCASDDLTAVIVAWANLPEAIRKAIVTLVESVREDKSAT